MDVISPLKKLAPLNAEVDRRHVRRVLDDELFASLIRAASRSEEIVFGHVGPDRAMLYTVAAYTGFRASELASLIPEQVALDGNPATLTVEAGYSKRRRLDTIPLQTELANRLRDWLKDRPAGQPLWPGEWATHHHAAAMLKADLAAAGIPYKDNRGRAFDFHALRGQFITGLARAGVHLVEAQVVLEAQAVRREALGLVAEVAARGDLFALNRYIDAERVQGKGK
jgi:integrase